jgi:hypothetical protein
LAFAWEKARKLSYILAAVGIATAISIGTAIAMYSPSVRGLNALWERTVPESERRYRAVNAGTPASKGIGWLFRPWRALPFIFIATWIAVVLVKLIK